VLLIPGIELLPTGNGSGTIAAETILYGNSEAKKGVFLNAFSERIFPPGLFETSGGVVYNLRKLQNQNRWDLLTEINFVSQNTLFFRLR
jgi:hypothetical protein